jgi:hypothetical protein
MSNLSEMLIELGTNSVKKEAFLRNPANFLEQAVTNDTATHKLMIASPSSQAHQLGIHTPNVRAHQLNDAATHKLMIASPSSQAHQLGVFTPGS